MRDSFTLATTALSYVLGGPHLRPLLPLCSFRRAWESVGYMTNGEADDWGWGEEHAVSLTLEVGSSKDSFWPSPSRVGPIAAETVLSATY